MRDYPHRKIGAASAQFSGYKRLEETFVFEFLIAIRHETLIFIMLLRLQGDLAGDAIGAGEVSVHFDAKSGRWRMIYLDAPQGAIMLREATSPQGVWSEPVVLASATDYPSLYGGFIHPWSTATDLYFTMSTWNSYQVYLMHAKIGR